MSVLALARKRLALFRGTVPNAVPAGQTPSGEANGSPGTLGTGGTLSAPSPIADADTIEERASLAADAVPACYLDPWARLKCQRPSSVDPESWRRTIDDAGLFLDAWGAQAAMLEWTAGDLFDVPHEGRARGLLWQLRGERVEALDATQARVTDGRTIRLRRAETKEHS